MGRSDAKRNCVSNVREAGLTPENAACKRHTLLCKAHRQHLSGIALKDETTDELDHAKGMPPEALASR